MKWRSSPLVAALCLLIGCKGSSDKPVPAPPPSAPVVAADAAPAVPTPGTVDTAQTGSGSAVGSGAAPVIHGEKWNGTTGDDEGGGIKFTQYKEMWVYVDGVPKGVMMYAELPPTLPKAWADDIESLDFKPGDPPPHEKKIQKMRWRVADYLAAIGVDINKVKVLYIHGSGYVRIPHDELVKYKDGITFDFMGNDLTKARFYWPKAMPINTMYDRYAAISVFIDKPPLELDEHNNPSIDGKEVTGIPYHGNPERGGVRVYVDGKLAMVIKRNLLGEAGRIGKTDPRWDLRALLKANGVVVEPVAADVVVEGDRMNQHRDRVDAAYLKDVSFGTSSQASGEVTFGADNRPTNALLLYTKGHVPPDEPLGLEMQRDWQPAKKH